jgi:hypothetical protein
MQCRHVPAHSQTASPQQSNCGGLRSERTPAALSVPGQTANLSYRRSTGGLLKKLATTRGFDGVCTSDRHYRVIGVGGLRGGQRLRQSGSQRGPIPGRFRGSARHACGGPIL